MHSWTTGVSWASRTGITRGSVRPSAIPNPPGEVRS